MSKTQVELEAMTEAVRRVGAWAHGGQDPREVAGEWTEGGFNAATMAAAFEAGAFDAYRAQELIEACSVRRGGPEELAEWERFAKRPPCPCASGAFIGYLHSSGDVTTAEALAFADGEHDEAECRACGRGEW